MKLIHRSAEQRARDEARPAASVVLHGRLPVIRWQDPDIPSDFLRFGQPPQVKNPPSSSGAVSGALHVSRGLKSTTKNGRPCRRSPISLDDGARSNSSCITTPTIPVHLGLLNSF